VQDSTANKYHRECSAAWTWAVDSGYAAVNPWIGLAKLKVATKDPIVLSAEEWRAVIAGSEDHALHAVICTALYAGLRNAEICRLRWEDVDFSARVLRVACDRERVTKSRSGRTVPLSDDLAVVLSPLKGNGPVFRTQQGSLWTPETISSAVSEVSRMVSVRFTLQVLRRTFASICAQDLGVPKTRVQSWLGHASITTTESYYIERRDGEGTEAPLLRFD
jgi:integrase/recombinase XerC